MKSTAIYPLLNVLDIQHPEWRPLLAAIDEAVLEGEHPSWARSVPAIRYRGRSGWPLLHGAVVELAPRTVARWVVRVLNVNPAAAGQAAVGLGRALAAHEIDPLLLMEIAVTRDAQRVAELARAINSDPALLYAQTPLIARPLLQACRRSWADCVPADWSSGYCPICGGWPVLAEVRGLHGSRRLRCGDCGGDWSGQWLCCPFCGERDHERLGSLASTETVERHSVEVCDGCGGYIKSVMSLTPMSADDVVLHDLASLELDVAAVDRGYRRPQGKGHELAVRVLRKPSRLRELFGLSP